MILSGHQPTYLPGIILFNKIALSDAFMFVGHCQYSPKSWQTRNYLRGHDGKPQMLSVPVQKDLGQSINETKFAGDHWKRKHLRAIELAYSKRPFFERYFPLLKSLLIDGVDSLGALNIGLTFACIHWFGLRPKIYESSHYQVSGHKTDMLISMSKAVGADEYLSNEGARAYVDEAKMQSAGIKHRWQKFTHPVYDQGAPFIPNLSAIDLLFNCGPDSGRIIRECGHVG